jgi:hypothetical protein
MFGRLDAFCSWWVSPAFWVQESRLRLIGSLDNRRSAVCISNRSTFGWRAVWLDGWEAVSRAEWGSTFSAVRHKRSLKIKHLGGGASLQGIQIWFFKWYWIICCKVSLYVPKLSALSNHNQVPCNRGILKLRPIIRKIQAKWRPKITMMKRNFRVTMSSLFTMRTYLWSRLQSGGPQCVKVLFGGKAEQSLLQNEPPPQSIVGCASPVTAMLV